MSSIDLAVAALAAVTARLPGGGEARAGQQQMVEAVARAIDTETHLVVQAGTGTGKSLGYLVPVLLSGRRTVVATATKALQDQLHTKDLPFLAEHLGVEFRWSVLKGRSNYVCRQRLGELDRPVTSEQLGLDGLAEQAKPEELLRIRTWAAFTPTGDRAELDFEPSTRTWTAVSVGVRECPGVTRCPSGAECFAEAARRDAQRAQIIVVNMHLLALDLALGGSILPEHDLVVVDEAHQLEDIVAAASGVELSAGRFGALSRAANAVLARGETRLGDVDAAGASFADACARHTGKRVPRPLAGDLAAATNLARDRVERLANALRSVPDDGPGDVGARKQRAMQAATALLVDIDALLNLRESDVAWVDDQTSRGPVLHIAPIDVAAVLSRDLWPHRTVVLTSATLPSNLPQRLGLDAANHDVVDVGSPFDYDNAALLYCAASLPDPRSADYRQALHAELEALIVAAGGRTLALFTSWKAMRDAVDHLRPRLPWPVLAQGDLPKATLLTEFNRVEDSCLFATMSFWQGVDVPGAALSLVTVDRLPFPRPDNPLLEARRERAGAAAFRAIDLPRAAMLLAQGAGRLIRTANDRGVVAVFDPRLATNRSYRWDIINALPPMRRTRQRHEAEAFLRAIRDAAPAVEVQ